MKKRVFLVSTLIALMILMTAIFTTSSALAASHTSVPAKATGSALPLQYQSPADCQGVLLYSDQGGSFCYESSQEVNQLGVYLAINRSSTRVNLRDVNGTYYGLPAGQSLTFNPSVTITLILFYPS